MMYQFRVLRSGEVTARALILSVLNTVGTDQQTIAELVQTGAAFEIDGTAMRVAATRLLREGLLESPERGLYRRGQRAETISRHARNWQNVEKAFGAWDGNWLVNLAQHLGRTDRKQLRAGERAFGLLGYRDATPGVWVRPDNLSETFAVHRERLVGLGMDPGIYTLRTVETALPAGADWRDLWPTEDLLTQYEAAIKAMRESLQHLANQSPAEAARESLLIGQAVIRAINLDPLLPAEFGVRDRFMDMVNAMKAYNTAGRAAWKSYRGQSLSG